MSLLGRMAARVLLGQKPAPPARDSRRYAAAKNDRNTSSWRPTNQGINHLLASAGNTIRDRIRQLVRDFPYSSHAVDVNVNYIVGNGVEVQPRVLGPDGKPARAINQKIEDGWKWWCDEADAEGKLHWVEIERLIERQRSEIGESLLIQTVDKEPGRHIPFALRVLEPDWLTDLGARAGQNRQVSQGVEYDTRTGKLLAHWIADPNHYGNAVRVPAQYVIHGFRPLRPGQLRGVTDMASAMLIIRHLGEFMGSEIDAARVASKIVSFIYTERAGDIQAASQGKSNNTDDGYEKPRIEEVEDVVNFYLRQGEKIEFADNPRPSSKLSEFDKLAVRMLAVALNRPYALISGDYEGMNYSVTRGVLNEAEVHISADQGMHIRQFLRPIFYSVLDWLVLSGRLHLPGYAANPAPYRRAEFFPPAMPSPDPLKEGKNDLQLIQGGLNSRTRYCRKRGFDFADLVEEMAADQELLTKKGISFQDQETSLANNPAAISGED